MGAVGVPGTGTEVVRYNYRLRPGVIAERTLIEEWHRCRFLWNEAVHQQKTGVKPTFAKLSKLSTEARARSSWLRDGSQVAQQQMLRTYAQALDVSFTVKGRGRPCFKARKKCLPSLEYTRRGCRIRDGRLVLPKGVSIPVVGSRELPSDPSSVRITCDALGHRYASFVVTRVAEPVPVAEEGSGVGIDWGVSRTATATEERFDLPHAGHRKRCAAELAKSRRRMARRRRGREHPPSRGYRQARKQAARIQKKAARQNRHDGRIWAKNVVVAVKDFKPRFPSKTNMARKAADAAVGAIKRELVEQGRRAGRKVVRPAYTTMTCSGCFARAEQPLGLGERIFRCWVCGQTACRDRNAARVILAVAERGHTGVDDVSQVDHLPSGGGAVAV